MRKITIAAIIMGLAVLLIMLPTRHAANSASGSSVAPAEATDAPALLTETTQTPAMEAAATPSASPIPAPVPFSIAWISDTQAYTTKDNDVFSSMTQWIADTQEEYNTVMTVHTGDIVYNPYQPYQWENAQHAFSLLPDDMRILTVAGNHDFLEKGDPNTPYLDTRPDTDYDPKHAENAEGYVYYTAFSAGGVNLLVFSLSYGFEVAASDWVNEVCKEYSDYYAILCLHTYIDSGGYSSVGKRLIEQVVKQSPNIRLVVCGHARGTAYLPEMLDDDGDGIADRTVHQMMTDMQDDTDKGIGYLRILRFHPDEDTIEVVTYSPVLDHFGYETYGGDRFGGTKILENAGLKSFLTYGSEENH